MLSLNMAGADRKILVGRTWSGPAAFLFCQSHPWSGTAAECVLFRNRYELFHVGACSGRGFLYRLEDEAQRVRGESSP